MAQRDLEQEQLLGEIILARGDVLSFLNDTDGTMEEKGHDDDGSGARTPEQGAVAKSGEVYILIKPLLTRCINCFVCTYINTSFFF